MLPFNAHKNSYGFTVIEILIILVIVGTLSAISAPTFIGFLNRSKVNNAVAQVQGALQESQRQAIRKSKKCTLFLDTTTNQVTGSCLVTGTRTLPQGVAMATNVVGNIEFGIRGNTKFTTDPTDADFGNTILYWSDAPTLHKKCVAISNGIGILRSGTYPDAAPTTPAASITTTCKQSQ